MAIDYDATWPLLASQMARDDGRSPERQLMAAVLLTAIREAQGFGEVTAFARKPEYKDGMRDRLRADAMAWLASDDDSWPFHFCSICRHLGIDPRRIRATWPTLPRIPSSAGYRSTRRGTVSAPRVYHRERHAPRRRSTSDASSNRDE